MQFHKKMFDDATILSADTDYPTMIAGLLTKQILPHSTVLAFSRHGEFIKYGLLKGEAEVFTFKELDSEDVQYLINMATDRLEQRQLVLGQIRKIAEDLQNQILFVKEILKLSLRGKMQLDGIRSASELFISIILGNLQYQDLSGVSGYSELSAEVKESLKKMFLLCKQNLQKNPIFSGSDSDSLGQSGVFKGDKIGNDRWKSNASDVEFSEFLHSMRNSGLVDVPTANSATAKKMFLLYKQSLQKNPRFSGSDSDSLCQCGVFKGDKIGNDRWKSDASDVEFSLDFLRKSGLFEVPTANSGSVVLTAGHLSFVEFMAAAGILLSSDIKSELDKIENEERFKAVSVYIRYFLSNFVIFFSKIIFQ